MFGWILRSRFSVSGKDGTWLKKAAKFVAKAII